MTTHFLLDSPVGPLTLVKADAALVGLYMDRQRHVRGAPSFGARARSGFEAIVEQLEEYFAGQRRQFTLTLAPAGTPFQRRVWEVLETIPYGETRTYAQVAAAIGNPAAVRAVGLANGRNPISIVVPCHRVIGSDGTLTGYGGGVDRKRFLLELETPGRRPAVLF